MTTREEGIEEGVEKGREQEKENFVINLLRNTNFEISKIAALANTSEAFVEKHRDAIKHNLNL